MHAITTRPPTDDEWTLIRRRVRGDYGGVVWAFIIGIFAVTLSLWTHEWMAPVLGRVAASIGRIAVFAAGVSTILWLLKMHFRHERKRLRGAIKDLEEGIVEEIHVKDAEVVYLRHSIDEQCHLCFDLGDDRLLYLEGDWIFTPETYGLDLKTLTELAEERVNLLPDPHGFPSSEFVLSRLPGSGAVLSVEVLGEYLHPKGTIDVMEPEHDFRDSEIFAGRLDRVAVVLASAHDERNATTGDAAQSAL